MRTVSFVEHLEFECHGNIYSKAITVGDADNDQGNELIVGSITGEVNIYKGTDTSPWRKVTDLGMVTCVVVGDVCNHKTNYVVACTVEGWCHLISVKSDAAAQDQETLSEEAQRLIRPTYKQHLTANSKVVVIADIDGDGKMELVVGFSDRKVRSYRWQDTGKDLVTGQLTGKFVMLETWQLAGQLSSMTVHKKANGSIDLMVSQPGGAYVTLLGSSTEGSENGKVSLTSSLLSGPTPESIEKTEHDGNGIVPGPSLIYHPLGTARARNPNVTTEIYGNISRQMGEETTVPSYCAICTLDGTLTLIDSDRILWSVYVDHQLFELGKLDVTGDGTEEVVACSTDGHTYIVNLNRDVVRFHFEEDVAAFCAGNYCIEGKNVPCLVYVTFNNRILVYYKIALTTIGTSNLLNALQDQPEVNELLNYFNCDSSKPEEIRKLFHWCLYGIKPRVCNDVTAEGKES